MKAKVKEAFPGRPDNEIKTRTIEIDETITGDLAKVAVENGWAEEVKDQQESKASPADATEEEVLAYLKGLEPAPTKQPKVKEVSAAMKKKATGATIEEAWAAFTKK